jgi:hypothetical protein
MLPLRTFWFISAFTGISPLSFSLFMPRAV